MTSLATHTWIEVSIRISRPTPVLLDQARRFFIEQSIPESSIAIFEEKGRSKIAVYTRSRRRIETLKRAFRAEMNGINRQPGVQDWRFQAKILRRRDWLDKWRNTYRIMPLGPKLTLVPLEKRKEYHPNHRLPVYLDPGSAFGTGLHETTRLCLLLMQKLASKFDTFLDLGTGTGILAVAAHRLGARKIVAIDNDRSAVATARRNLLANGCTTARILHRDLARFHTRARFDLVTANLTSDLLQRHRSKIIRPVNPGGHLILSGILMEGSQVFLRRFRARGFPYIRILTGRKWAVFYWKQFKISFKERKSI
jgi:ribosomal protein L11 methyltransferase